MRHKLTIERKMQMVYSLSIMAVGICLYVFSLSGNVPILDNLYGAPAYDIGINVWGLSFITCSLFVIFGLWVNGNWKYSPVMRFVGYSGIFYMFVFIFASSVGAKNGQSIAAFSGAFFTPFNAYLWFISITDLARRTVIGSCKSFKH